MEPPKAIRALLASKWYFATIKETLCLSLPKTLDTTQTMQLSFGGLMKGLQLAQEYGYHKMIVEGDSQINLSIFSKIIYGADPDGISPYW
jgi:hypothetical protein